MRVNRSMVAAAVCMLIIAAAAMMRAQTSGAPPPPRVQAVLSLDGGKTFTRKVYVLEGATVDNSTTPPVIRLAPPASVATPVRVKWGDIEGAPTFKFNGPWLVTQRTAEDNVTTISLAPQMQCFAAVPMMPAQTVAPPK